MITHNANKRLGIVNGRQGTVQFLRRKTIFIFDEHTSTYVPVYPLDNPVSPPHYPLRLAEPSLMLPTHSTLPFFLVVVLMLLFPEYATSTPFSFYNYRFLPTFTLTKPLLFTLHPPSLTLTLLSCCSQLPQSHGYTALMTPSKAETVLYVLTFCSIHGVIVHAMHFSASFHNTMQCHRY